jgi:hypothetical protein
VRLEVLGKFKKINLIGIRNRDLPACSIVPQPTSLPRAQSMGVREGIDLILKFEALDIFWHMMTTTMP